MDRKEVDQEALFGLLDRGWHPVWFAVEGGCFLADLCCPSRLQDHKVMAVIYKFGRPVEDTMTSIQTMVFIQEFFIKGLRLWEKEFIQMYSDSIAECGTGSL